MSDFAKRIEEKSRRWAAECNQAGAEAMHEGNEQRADDWADVRDALAEVWQTMKDAESFDV